MALILVIVILAALGGFLGNLLEFAGWAILIMAVIGAALGFAAYRFLRDLVS